MRLAQQLMFAHRITDAQVREHARAKAIATGQVHADDLTTGPIGRFSVRQDAWLAMAVGDVCGCGVYRSWHSGRNALLGYGLPADLAVARELFGWVAAKMRAERKTYCKARRVTAGSVAGRSFGDGFALALLGKARAAKVERMASTETVTVQRIPEEGGTSSADYTGALVVVVGEAERAHETALTVKAKQLGVGVGRSPKVRCDSAARAAGGAAARGVSLSREVVRP
jgi:hypothetical protein